MADAPLPSFHPPKDNLPPAHSAPGVFITTYEMALTPPELHRLAVHLAGGDHMVASPRAASVRLPDGQTWTITLGPERQRRIALLAFPICDAEIRLDGFDPAAAKAFLARFHKVFQKGGG